MLNLEFTIVRKSNPFKAYLNFSLEFDEEEIASMGDHEDYCRLDWVKLVIQAERFNTFDITPELLKALSYELNEILTAYSVTWFKSEGLSVLPTWQNMIIFDDETFDTLLNGLQAIANYVAAPHFETFSLASVPFIELVENMPAHLKLEL